MLKGNRRFQLFLLVSQMGPFFLFIWATFFDGNSGPGSDPFEERTLLFLKDVPKTGNFLEAHTDECFWLVDSVQAFVYFPKIL